MSSKKHTVTLAFSSEEKKKYFLGQMIDGLGEDHFAFTWDTRKAPALCESIRCDPCGELWEHHMRMKKLGYG